MKKDLFLLDFANMEFSLDDPAFCIVLAVVVLLAALLAILLIATFGKRGRRVPAARPGELVCPSCGAPIDDDSVFCSFCGRPVAAPAPAPSPEPGGRICPSCGALIDEDSLFCASCGVSLAAAAPAAPEPGRVCPACGTPCGDEALFCPACGSPIAPPSIAIHIPPPLPDEEEPEAPAAPEIPAEPAEAPEPEAASVRRCPSCGEAQEDDALFCPSCGTKLAP